MPKDPEKARRRARCPYCTRTDIGLHPTGVMVPHTTRRNGSGEHCFGGGTKP
jgi:hypothetical protein